MEKTKGSRSLGHRERFKDLWGPFYLYFLGCSHSASSKLFVVSSCVESNCAKTSISHSASLELSEPELFTCYKFSKSATAQSSLH